MPLSRRDFLKRTGLAAAGFGVYAVSGCGQQAPNVPAAPKENNDPAKTDKPGLPAKAAIVYGTAIGPGRAYSLDDKSGEARNVLSIINLDALTNRDLPAEARRARLINLDFFAHGVSPHPRYPHKAVLFEKHGKGCCEVDLAKGEVTQAITTEKDRQFYGHGVFSHDGMVMYCTEVVLSEKKRGVIMIRDSSSYSILDEFPSHGTSPHDCVLIDGGRTLMITNGGDKFDINNSPPSLTFVDVKSQKLLEKLEFETPRINAGHVAITAKREIAVVSAMRDGLPVDSTGAVSFRSGSDAMCTMMEPAEVTARMKGETLSVAIHEESGTVGVTNPDGNLVTFWNMRERKFIRGHDLKMARGIALTLDKRYFAVSYAESPQKVHLQLIDAKSLDLIAGAKVEDSCLSGSHFIVYAL